MTLPTWATPFTDDLSLVTAEFLNGYVRTQIPKALDGVGGGTYTPVVTLSIQGEGLEFVVKSGKTITLNSGSTVARSGKEVLTGAGATTAWRIVDGATGNTTYDVTYDEITVPASVSGSPTVYTLRDATSPAPEMGNRIRFTRNGAALTNSVRFIRETGSTIVATMNASAFSWVEFTFKTAPTDATARWRVSGAGGDITVAAVL